MALYFVHRMIGHVIIKVGAAAVRPSYFLIFSPMKTVVLDGYAMNPGDLNWDTLEQLAETVIYERSSVKETPDRIADADIVLTNKALLTPEIIRGAPSLKYIGVMATGYNIVDMAAAAERHITVTNVPAYSTASVAQLVFALMLEQANQVARYAQSVKAGDWTRSKDFSYQLAPGMELQNKTLGIVGLGQIGRAVATIALAFGMKVIASHKHPERDKMEGVRFVDEQTLFREADIVSLHCPLNKENKHFVNRRLLQAMKPSAFLINTSRGALIHEQDLADALNNGIIAWAGLDVLSTEPPGQDNPLLQAKNCLITPHIAWATYEARFRLMKVVVQNLQSFLQGNPLNVVGYKG
jgi:glycerate dehydrogenase